MLAEQVKLPFFVLHGEADTVTDPEVSRALYQRAASTDKTIKLYPGMWHGLTAGEPDENVDAIFFDIVAWLNERSRNWTLEDRLRKLLAVPGAKFIDGEKNGEASERHGHPRRLRRGLLCGLAGRTHHHAEM
jgi:acylglycerol lipase